MTSLPQDQRPDTDLIDEACREEFERAWLTGERKDISDCLPAPDSVRYRPTLQELICIQMELQWKAAHHFRSYTTVVGTTEKELPRPVLVEDYAAMYPDVDAGDIKGRLIRQEYLIRRRLDDDPNPDEYRKRFPGLDIETILPAGELHTVDAFYESRSAADDETSLPSDSIEGYQVLERIGAGGMGVVYRARQLAADRIVALKLIRADRLLDVSESARTEILERFRIEAQAAARLEHPHVVGVYEVNTTDPARPWFSMQFVEGVSLAEHLASGPVSCREAAGYSAQLADAIAMAHNQGILHRDLKPQNIFLRTDAKHLLVGDFGLAKFAVDESARTAAGDMLGTPAYMSPEQIRNASEVTTTADIWSIGATLYHLLAGRPPFQAATAMETLRQVLDHEPPSLRTLNPDVDRDLETISSKCLQKTPQHRYQTAAALAEDLQRYLNGIPISARPISQTERLYRWCRRNPLTATLAAAAAAGMAAALIALLIGYRTATSALRESDRSHRMARQTVNDLFTDVSETMLLEKPGLQPLRKQLLGRALSYYRRFAEAGRDSPALNEEVGDVWFRIGRIEQELGDPEASDTAFRRALNRQQKLVNQQATIARRTALSSTWNALGNLHIAQRRWNAATGALRTAFDLRQTLVLEYPGDPEVQRLFANTIMNLGAVQRNEGQFAEALKSFQRAVDLQRQLLVGSSLEPETRRLVQRHLAMALYNSANAAFDIQSTSIDTQVLRPLNDAIDLFLELLQDQPDSYADRRRLILCRQLQADANPDRAQASSAALEAAQQMQQLVAENPAVPRLVREWVQLEFLAGRLLRESGRDAEALKHFDAVVSVLTVEPAAADQAATRDLAMATAEAALAAASLSAADAGARLLHSRERLDRSSAKTADDQELAEIRQRVDAALRKADN